MAGLDISSFVAALKTHYTTFDPVNLTYKDNPFLALLSKYENFGGENLHIKVTTSNPQGVSVDFTESQTAGDTNGLKINKFALTRVNLYSIATVTNETIEASMGDKNSVIEAGTATMDGAMEALGRNLNIALYRGGYGYLGTIGSNTGSTITLATTADSANFEQGQRVVFASAETSGALRDSGDYLTVLGVNRSTGVITFTGAVSGVSGISNGDAIFLKGCREDASSPSRLMLSGLEAWLPSGGASSSSFFGLDRTVDPTRLGGLSYSAVGNPIDEVLMEAASRVRSVGGKLSHFFMSFDKFSELAKQSEGKRIVQGTEKVGQIGFDSLNVLTPAGVVKVLADNSCPSNRIFGVQMDTWKLYSLGKHVKIINTDGMDWRAKASADAIEIRLGFRGNLGCSAPGYNINVQV